MALASTSWKGGQSGNPGGRPKGIAAIAKLIAKETRDGAEIVEYCLKVFRDANAKPKDRQDAANWLTERFIGKALQHVDVDVTTGRGIDMSKLSPAALAELAAQDADESVSPGDDEPAG